VGVSRHVAAIGAAVVLSVPAGVTIAPGANAGPLQEEDSSDEGDESASSQAVIEIDVDVAEADPGVIAGALGDIQANVAAQLAEVQTAQAAVTTAVQVLADATTAVSNTELRIEELVVLSDAVVVESFVNPPYQSALDILSSESASDATLKQIVLDMQADDDADVLEEYENARSQLEDERDVLDSAAADAEAARADAEAALADLTAAVSQQTQFVLEVQTRMNTQATDLATLAQTDPELAALLTQSQQELASAISGVEEAEAARQAQQLLDEAAQRDANRTGDIVCPVDGTVRFTDTWGDARSGGRTHKGTDMMAASGTPTVAPESGEVVHRSTSLGGLSWYVYGDSGDTYYGTHLSSYENQGAGRVEAGEVIGYVGSSGNASASAPHLHFEIHPGGGSPVNPYPTLDQACPEH
jgi:murein DD-endopeptidase MepM/ murein hydrolase activator NlpD